MPGVVKDLESNVHKQLMLDSLPDYKVMELFQDLIFTVIVDRHGYEIYFLNIHFLHYQEVHTCEDNS